MGKGQFFQQMVLGKLHIHMQKNETGPLFYTEPKNLTVDQRPNTALEENREESLSLDLPVTSQTQLESTGKENSR